MKASIKFVLMGLAVLAAESAAQQDGPAEPIQTVESVPVEPVTVQEVEETVYQPDDDMEVAEEIPQKTESTQKQTSETQTQVPEQQQSSSPLANQDTKASIATTPPKIVQPPTIELLTPIKRKDVDVQKLAVKPCGATKIGKVHYETTPGSRNIIGWRVVKPSPNGTCVIRVSDSPRFSDFQIVKVTDGSQAEDGSFPCGRNETPFEAKEFKIPRDLICDTCILSLEWRTDEGSQYRCADFESLASEVPECFGQCLNGGICKNGKCACPSGFSGLNCQFEDEPQEGPSVFQAIFDDGVVLLVYALMILLIVVLFFIAYRLYQAAVDRYRRNEELYRLRQEEMNKDRDDKITAANSGLPGKSKFEQYDQ